MRLAFNDFELSAWRRLETLRLEQLDRSRRCKQVQEGLRGFRLFCRGADAAGENDVALQFRRQPADKRDSRRIDDGRDANHDKVRLAARDGLDSTAAGIRPQLGFDRLAIPSRASMLWN